MKGTVIIALAATSLSVSACTTTPGDNTLASVGTGAAVGGAAGAGVGALAGFDPITGAVVGAAVGGLAGAYWADKNNDGYADGYVREGQYYQGQPNYAAASPTTTTRSCPSTLGSAATGAGLGAAAGAGVGALASGVSVLEGALVGAAVGGVAGAVWADQNNDGCVDGYMREGQYYSGAPTQPAPAATTTTRTGERG